MSNTSDLNNVSKCPFSCALKTCWLEQITCIWGEENRELKNKVVLETAVEG